MNVLHVNLSIHIKAMLFSGRVCVLGAPDDDDDGHLLAVGSNTAQHAPAVLI